MPRAPDALLVWPSRCRRSSSRNTNVFSCRPRRRGTVWASRRSSVAGCLVAVYPLRPLPLIGCDLHGDGQPIWVGCRVPFAGGVFDQTDVAWDKGVRGPIGEPDDRPSHETHLPAPEGGWMKIQEVPRGSFLYAKTHGAGGLDLPQRLGLDLFDMALAIAARIQPVDAHDCSSSRTRSAVCQHDQYNTTRAGDAD